jgi:hypothetical protein
MAGLAYKKIKNFDFIFMKLKFCDYEKVSIEFLFWL